jgi:hypothetical protein
MAAICATGRFLPPYLIFPRAMFKDFMLFGAPPGTEGTATPSGWSNETIFVKYLKFFMKHVRPLKDEPHLLILDNHVSHRSVEGIQLCKDNGIILLTFPPHCTHRMQPLDTHCFGSFRSAYNVALNNWHLDHPGKSFTIYNIADTVGKAYPRAFTPSNIIHGFRDTGIFPLDMDVYPDDRFAPSLVTDQPLMHEKRTVEDSPDAVPADPVLNVTPAAVTPVATVEATISPTPQPCCSKSLPSVSPVDVTTKKRVSPEEVRPYPKAPERSEGQKKRKTGRTTILTDTPEKDAIMQQKCKKVAKKPEKRQQAVKKRGRPKKIHVVDHDENDDPDDPAPVTQTNTKILPLKEKVKKKLGPRRIWKKKASATKNEESSEEDLEGIAPLSSDSESDGTSSTSGPSEKSVGVHAEEDAPLQTGDYILTKVHGEKRDFKRHYICQVGSVAFFLLHSAFYFSNYNFVSISCCRY